jgi:hypothetical protein
MGRMIGRDFPCGSNQASMCAKRFSARHRAPLGRRELTQRRATLEDVFVEITHSDAV